VVIADALFQAGGMPTITIARLASRSSTPIPETTATPKFGATSRLTPFARFESAVKLSSRRRYRQPARLRSRISRNAAR